ncbi:MAG: cytochrome c biogenesis protein ResB, partial [Flavobacteriaceae bacterium]|nr:cytochrome c biogenesis protein ResB [Flavobacteriaceae bacterium]
MLNLIKKILFSNRLMAILFLLFAVAMAFGTFVESWYSTETARIYIYNATWFEAIMVFFVINFLGNISKYRLWRREKWPILTLHLSWILILVGAFVTRYISFEGMMPIREGATENIFFSEKTYFTLNVDGEIDGELKRRPFQDEIIATPEGLKSSLPWKFDFDGQPFEVDYVGFMRGAQEGIIPEESGMKLLKIVEAGDGNRHEHYLEEGKVANIHNMLFALNNPTDGAINIVEEEGKYTLQTPFEGTFLRMADQFSGIVLKDSIQELHLRSLYTIGEMQLVIPEPLIMGRTGVIQVPENEITEATQDAIIIHVSSGGETVEKAILGGKGSAQFNSPFEVGGLNFSAAYGSKIYTLPFQIQLRDFIAEKYPGTEKGYASFMSKITVKDERPFDYDIYMNHILDHRGYRFFQASFDPDEKGTVLSVNHDAWGTRITYAGYFMLYLGLMALMFFGKTRFRELVKSLDKLRHKKASLVVAALFISASQLWSQDSISNSHQHAGPTQLQVDSLLQANAVSKEHAALFGKLVIQDDGGRMKPMNTFASEILRKLRFKTSYNDLDADQVMVSMMLNPALWYNVEFIALDKKKQNDSLRNIIGVPKGQVYVKATDFFDASGKYKLGPFVQEAYATNTPNKFQQDFKDVDLRLGLLNRALSGEIIKIFPLLNDDNNKWISAVEYRSGKFTVADTLYGNFIKNAVPYYLMSVQKGVESGDFGEADKLLEAFHQNQINHGSEVLPSDKKVETEVLYNKLDIFNRLYKYYAL